MEVDHERTICQETLRRPRTILLPFISGYLATEYSDELDFQMLDPSKEDAKVFKHIYDIT